MELSFEILKKGYRWWRDIYWGGCRKKNAVKCMQEELARMEKAKEVKHRTFYVIRRQSRVGLFSYVQTALGQIEYAVKKGYIPIIDMKHYDNTYLELDEIGKINAWELFFEQVCEYDLEYVYANEHYILSEDCNIKHIPCSDGFYKKEALWYWGELYSRFVRLNEKSYCYINAECDTLFHNNFEKVLGIITRGTDYKSAKGHPVQPDVKTVLSKAEEYMSKHGYNKIYLATEEKKVVDMFEIRFPRKIVVNKRAYYDDYDTNRTLSEMHFDRENDAYLKGMEYLSSIVILSKCEGLICGLNGGTYAALYFNGGKYKDVYFYDLGTQ